MHTYFEHFELSNTYSLDNFAFGVFRVDKAGKLAFVNKYMLQLLGFDNYSELQDSIKGSYALKLCFDPKRLLSFIKDSQKTFYEYKWTTKNGQKKLLREFGHEVIIDPDTIYYDCVVEDVSEKSLIDRLFQDIKSSDYSVLKAIPDYILIVSRNGDIVESKNNFHQLFSKKNTSTIHTLDEIFEPAIAETTVQLINEVLETGETKSFSFEYNLLGTQKFFEARFAIRSYDEALMILRDVTQQKIAEQQVLKFTEELKQLNATKDKFFSIIGHDLRTPINGLLNYSEILSEECDVLSKEEIKEFAGYIGEIARTTNTLLNNLLEWSRIQSGKIAFEPKETHLYLIVDKIFRLLSAMALSKQIKLINNVQTDLICYADENMLQSIILNITSNAIKFTNLGGQIRIDSTKFDEYVKISIADNGVGITEENIKLLLDSNITFTTLGTVKEKGTGLGLMLSKEFVKIHNGNIWAESELGKGSTFSFTIKNNYSTQA